MKKAIISVILFWIGISFPAWASQPVHWVATEELIYDDNIYLKDKKYGEKKSSVINSLHVGADYRSKLPQSGVTIQAGGLLGGNLYTENPSHNNYVDANGGFTLQNEKWTLSEQILYTSDPANSSLTDRTKRLNNTATVSYQTSHRKPISFGITVQDVFDRYFEGTMHYLNRNRFNSGGQIFYNFTPQTNVFAEYMFSDIVYRGNKQNNSTSHSAGLGIHGQLTGKLSGTAKMTYDMRHYSRDIAHTDNQPDVFGYFAELTWKATSRDTIRLLGERGMEETLYGANRYFVDTFLSLYFRHKINTKWAVSLVVGWEDLRYRTKVLNQKRHDHLYTVRPKVDYAFQDWLIGSVWYQYRIRSSNVNWPDYVSNRAGASIRVLF